jgi:hypothetical protein
MLVISALGRLRQEDHEFESNLGYIGSSRTAGLYCGSLPEREIDRERERECTVHRATWCWNRG